jgi:hypothetical protein
MTQSIAVVPDSLHVQHPGRGECGLKALKNTGFCASTGQYVYGCDCGFRWFLFPMEIEALMRAAS